MPVTASFPASGAATGGLPRLSRPRARARRRAPVAPRGLLQVNGQVLDLAPERRRDRRIDELVLEPLLQRRPNDLLQLLPRVDEARRRLRKLHPRTALGDCGLEREKLLRRILPARKTRHHLQDPLGERLVGLGSPCHRLVEGADGQLRPGLLERGLLLGEPLLEVDRLATGDREHPFELAAPALELGQLLLAKPDTFSRLFQLGAQRADRSLDLFEIRSHDPSSTCCPDRSRTMRARRVSDPRFGADLVVLWPGFGAPTHRGLVIESKERTCASS